MRFFRRLKLVSWLGEYSILLLEGFPGGSEVKASACNVGDLGSIPGLERSPGEGNDNPLQYSCLGNPMDGGAWWGHKELSTTKWLHCHFGDIFHHPFKLKTTTYPTLEKSENEVTSKVTFINQPPMFYSSNTKHLSLSFPLLFLPLQPLSLSLPPPFSQSLINFSFLSWTVSQCWLCQYFCWLASHPVGFQSESQERTAPTCSMPSKLLLFPAVLARPTDSPALWEKKKSVETLMCLFITEE